MRIPAAVMAAAAAVLSAACAAPAASTSPSVTPSPAASEAAPAWPTPPPDAPVVLFLGDSYTAGTALTSSELPSRWSTVLAAQQGWREVNAGCNGSGFTRSGPVCDNNYRDRIPTVASADPEVVVLLGGINDRGADPAELRAMVRVTVAALREAFPEARIVALTAFTFAEPAHPNLAVVNEELRALAAEFDLDVIDIGEPVLGDPALLAPDGLHPSVAGHAAIAAAVTAGL